MDKIGILILGGVLLSMQGCATLQPSVKKVEPVQEQINAARKVVGALAPTGSVSEKYSPVTGRHYSGTLEYEPGTGVRLVPVEE